MVTERLGEDRDLEYSKLFIDNSTYSADPISSQRRTIVAIMGTRLMIGPTAQNGSYIVRLRAGANPEGQSGPEMPNPTTCRRALTSTS